MECFVSFVKTMATMFTAVQLPYMETCVCIVAEAHVQKTGQTQVNLNLFKRILSIRFSFFYIVQNTIQRSFYTVLFGEASLDIG